MSDGLEKPAPIELAPSEMEEAFPTVLRESLHAAICAFEAGAWDSGLEHFRKARELAGGSFLLPQEAEADAAHSG